MERLLNKNEIIHTATITGLSLAGALLLLGPVAWFPSYYSPHFFGFAFLLSALLIYLSKKVFDSDDERKKRSALQLRYVIMLALSLNALGELYLYQLYRFGFQYDKLIHAANSLLFVVALTSFGEVWFSWSVKKSLTVAIIIVISCGFGWEFIEFFSDLLFGTKEFGLYGQVKFTDTALDLISNFLGIILAGAFIEIQERHSSGQQQGNQAHRELHQGKLF
ncbi:hypothetical protein HGA64_03620 [Candidatus Falkowbacteria bacterium]|nr:hypothetical protein [Candidatus Falkowbacteria bacterium]